jgi:hypothetical protein
MGRVFFVPVWIFSPFILGAFFILRVLNRLI